MAEPKVSVVIPCYNHGEYVDEAVNSVLAQTFQDFEIIIVNDGSTDEATNKLLANYNKPKTKVLTTENQGLPNARNNGIKIAKGEYICCLDADDKYFPQFLEKCVSALDNSDEKVAIATTWVRTFGEIDELWKTSDYDPMKLATEGGTGVHVASMFKRKVWEEVGGYSSNMAHGGFEDMSFWISIIAKGYKWICIPEELFNYRVKKNSMIVEARKRKIELLRKVIENNEEFYKKNYIEIILQEEKRIIATINDYDILVAENKKVFNELVETEKILSVKSEELDRLKNKITKIKSTPPYKLLSWFLKIFNGQVL
ncbi:MAG: glycosyltransferase family A protein [Candidatus Dojkabacteria bacterium]